jgi:hypothetical protein
MKREEEEKGRAGKVAPFYAQEWIPPKSFAGAKPNRGGLLM